MRPHVILVPYDSGHLRKRMGLGPEQILDSALKQLFSRIGVPFGCEEILLDLAYPTEIAAAFQLCREVAARVRECRKRRDFPIVLSGNCNVAVGTVAGCGSGDTGIIWFDAHGEATTPETTVSGFLDGMGISILTGECWRSLAATIPGFVPVPGKRIALFGARDLEPSEHNLLERMGVRQMTTLKQLEEHLLTRPKDSDHVYLHVDLDVLDPALAIANQWKTPGGMSPESLVNAVREIRKHAAISALGIASYEPALDLNGRALEAAAAVVESVLSRS